jgi:GT2 family glycosyltransferase
MDPQLAIIILNYRTARLTLDCLATLEGEVGPGVAVLVVDNASGDGSAEEIEAGIARRGWSGWARVLRSPTNGGFAAGNNLGLRAVKAEAYVLLNSDTLVRPGAMAALREAARERPEAGLIGPGILTASGELDYSAFRVAGPVSELIRAARTGPITRALRRFDPVLPLSERPFEPEWVAFSCVLVRRAVVEQIGLLDEGFFMYFEDVDYCRRARAAGWRVLYWPAAAVVHLAGGSSQVTSQAGQRRRAPRYYYEARARYFAKYYGRGGLWLANVLWHAGRLVALGREVFGRAPGHRHGEAVDIWINARRPLPPGEGAGT